MSDDQIARIVKDCVACNGTGEGVYYGKDWTGPTDEPCEPCGGTGKNLYHKRVVDEVISELTAERDSARKDERAAVVRRLRDKLIPLVADLIRLPTVPSKYNEAELLRREWVVTIAMRIKAVADGLIEREGERLP